MIRKNLKILLAIFIIATTTFMFSSSLVQATEAVTSTATTTSETAGSTTTSPEATTDTTTVPAENEIHNGDLYLFDNKVIMDKLVDGNVFIFGQEVEITGQVNGNLFVFANKLTFNNCYIRYSTFACANSVYYNGACNDLYVVASNDLEMSYDSYVVRDLKALTSNMKFRAAIGRNADLNFNSIDLGEGDNIPVVYGNLNYIAPSEVTIPEGVITETGTINYINSSSPEASATSISDIIINFLVCIVTSIIIYLLVKAFVPKFAEKIDNEKISPIKLLKNLGIGLITIIAVIFIFVLLLITQIGIKLAFILIVLFALLCLISVPLFAIVITNLLKPALKLDKKAMFLLVLSLVSIVLYGITLIPFVGGILSFLIKTISIGMLVNMFIPHKELTEEEKSIIEEEKKQAKEDKEKRKQEKAELKAAKKEEKLKAQESKKKETENKKEDK